MRLRWSRRSISLATALLLTGAVSVGHAGDRSADDTGKNVRDRHDEALTPDQQSNDPADVEITQKIRRSITKEDGLSTNARNVKIITIDRKVTLRGPVDSAKEKSIIAKKAQKVAGADKVDDQLEVAKP